MGECLQSNESYLLLQYYLYSNLLGHKISSSSCCCNYRPNTELQIDCVCSNIQNTSECETDIGRERKFSLEGSQQRTKLNTPLNNKVGKLTRVT